MLLENIVAAANGSTIYGEVFITITNLRSPCLIPSLRKFRKLVICECYVCKYTSLPYLQPKPRPLPKDHTGPTIYIFSDNSHRLCGSDPIYYRLSPKKKAKHISCFHHHEIIIRAGITCEFDIPSN